MRFITFILAVLWLGNVSAEDNFIHFNTENNMLMHNSVEDVVRDSLGYVWVGTNYGLNRLDGYRTINYLSEKNANGDLSNNHIKDLFIDSKNRLWIGTIGGGLNQFNYTDNNFIHYMPSDSVNSIMGLNVSAINEDHDGNIWIGIIGEGISKFNPEKGEFTNYNFSLFDPNIKANTNIRDLHCDIEGNIWVGFDFDRNGIYKIDVKTDKITFQGLSSNNNENIDVGAVRGIAELKDGTLLFAIWNSQLFKLNPKTDKQIQQVCNAEFFDNSHLTSIKIDEKEQIWISTWENGLYQLSSDFLIINNYKNNDYAQGSLSSNAINNLYYEKNNLWICLRDQGLNLLPLNDKMLNNLNTLKVSKHNTIDAHCFAKDENGIIWIGSRGQGLWKYNPTTKELQNFNKKKHPGLINENILTIKCSLSGILWLGTDGDFVGSFNPISNKFNFIPHHEGDWSSVYAIEETDSFLWCGTWGAGLKKLNKFDRTYTTINFEKEDQYNNSIFDIDLLADDLWLANFGMGLVKYNIKTNQTTYIYKDNKLKNQFPNESINDIFIDRNNTLWLSSSGGGLIHFNPINNKISILNTNNGLSSNVIQCVTADNNNNLWIGTNKGITKYNISSNQAFTFYKHNGLIINHLNKSALLFDEKESTLFIGSPKGVNFCSTDFLKFQEFSNPVVFNQLSVNNVDIDFQNSDFIYVSINNTKSIKLNHQQKIFTIGFSTMEFNSSFKSKYYYQLEGVNDTWVELPYSNNSIQFTNLDPGTHILKVKASNRDGIINKQESSIHIIVEPAWWQTFLFKILVILLILFIVFLIFYGRVRQMKKAHQKLESIVQERTIEIKKQKQELELSNQTKDKFFSIIGHDLRNPISTIDQFMEIIILDFETLPKETLMQYFKILKQTSSRTLGLLEDLMIWSRVQSQKLVFNKNEISVENAISKSFNLCESLAISKNVKLIITSPTNLIAYANSESVQTVIRNLITNAIKFSHENNSVEIKAIEQKEKILISIKDSGIGMSKTQIDKLFKNDQVISREGTSGETGTGLGLILCKEFVEHNGGKLWVASEVGQGSTFFFTLKKSENSI